MWGFKKEIENGNQSKNWSSRDFELKLCKFLSKVDFAYKDYGETFVQELEAHY